MKKTRRIFSETFKREKVLILEKGKMSVASMARMYEISETALYKWKAKYSSFPPDHRVVLETESDYLHMLQLAKQVENMERLIGSQQIKLDYLTKVIESANEHYEDDIEKKFG
jgi:transposase-like protein